MGLPSGLVDGSLPANAGDTDSIPGLGRFHTPWGNYACEPQLLSLCSRALRPKLLSPCAAATEACAPRACARWQEKALPWAACALQWRVAPGSCNQRKIARSDEDPVQQKN